MNHKKINVFFSPLPVIALTFLTHLVAMEKSNNMFDQGVRLRQQAALLPMQESFREIKKHSKKLKTQEGINFLDDITYIIRNINNECKKFYNFLIQNNELTADFKQLLHHKKIKKIQRKIQILFRSIFNHLFILSIGYVHDNMNSSYTDEILFDAFEAALTEFIECHNFVNNNFSDKKSSPIININERSQIKVIKLLLKQKYKEGNHSFRVINPKYKDKDGRSSLHWAACSNNLQTTQQLFSLKNAQKKLIIEPNGPDNNGMTPLHLAVQNNCYEMVEYLLRLEDEHMNFIIKRGPANKDGKTPLQLAQEKNNKQMEDLLRGYGAYA